MVFFSSNNGQKRGVLLDEGAGLTNCDEKREIQHVQQRPTKQQPTSNIYILFKKYIYIISNALCFEKYFCVGRLDGWTVFSEIFFSIFAKGVFF
jgi:hypothetical protein